MSVYTQISDILEKLKNINIADYPNTGDNAGSIFTASQVQGYIDQNEAAVEGVISLKYTMPTQALNPKSFLIIQKVVTAYTANDMYQILKLSGIIAVNPDESNRMASLYYEGKSIMDKLQNNLMILPDATRLTGLRNNVGYDRNAANNMSGQPFIVKNPTNNQASSGSGMGAIGGVNSPGINLQW